jgi:hypothetical protein
MTLLVVLAGAVIKKKEPRFAQPMGTPPFATWHLKKPA